MLLQLRLAAPGCCPTAPAYDNGKKVASHGVIRKWNDEKGYGFVACPDGSRDVFLHAKDIPSYQRRPRLGDRISFEPRVDGRGRLCASSARLQEGGASRGRAYLFFLGLAAAGFALAAFLGLVPVTRPTVLLGLYLLWSPIAFGVYLRDKRLAVAGGWRVPERVLHLIEIVGGWPGALLAQRTLRHKNRKPAYQFVFWAIVFTHLAIWAFWALENRWVGLL